MRGGVFLCRDKIVERSGASSTKSKSFLFESLFEIGTYKDKIHSQSGETFVFSEKLDEIDANSHTLYISNGRIPTKFMNIIHASSSIKRVCLNTCVETDLCEG